MEDEEGPNKPSGVTQPISANYQVALPERFSFKVQGWPKSIRCFDRFRKAASFHGISGEKQMNTLKFSMGDQLADDIFASLTLTEEESKTYDIVNCKIETYFIVKNNVIYERARFNTRVQSEKQTVDQLITALYELSKHCEFQGLRQELILDIIVVGIQDRKLSEKL